MDVSLLDDPETLEALRILARKPRPPLCPRCGEREQNPSSVNGWCGTCDAAQERWRRYQETRKERHA